MRLPSTRTPATASYAWLFDLLVRRTPAVTWAAAGELPAGFEVAEQFAVLASGPGRSFMVSLAAKSGTYAALTSYNALRSPRRRLARRVLALGLRVGLGGLLAGHRIDIGTAVGATPAQLADALLSEHLRALFGGRQLVIAVGGGSGPYRKPVLQVFSTCGTPLGYVKVGWNDWTKEAVRREASALRACSAAKMQLGVPVLLGHHSWHGLELLLTAPLPAGVRRLKLSSRLPDAALVREISRLSPGQAGELAGSTWWIGVRARIRSGITDAAARTVLEQAADLIEAEHGRAQLKFGGWHGDLVPWNLARLGSRLYAWDWESSTGDVPLGFDAVHFHFQVAFVRRQSPLGEAVAQAARKAGPALAALGVTAEVRPLVTALHLLELFIRHEEARSSSGDLDDRFYPAVAGVLQGALALPSAAAAAATDSMGLAS